MVADRVYRPGSLQSPNGRRSLLYFAAAVPTVGFVRGAADLNAVYAAALEGYAEARFIKRAQPIDTAARGKCASTPPQSSGRWPLGLRLVIYGCKAKERRPHEGPCRRCGRHMDLDRA